MRCCWIPLMMRVGRLSLLASYYLENKLFLLLLWQLSSSRVLLQVLLSSIDFTENLLTVSISLIWPLWVMPSVGIPKMSWSSSP